MSKENRAITSFFQPITSDGDNNQARKRGRSPTLTADLETATEVSSCNESSGDHVDNEINSGPSKKSTKSVQSEWTVKFPWLKVCEEEGVKKLSCTWCLKAGEKNAFTRGSTDTQASAISRHLMSKGHLRAAGNKQSQTIMTQQVQQARSQSNEKQVATMRTVLFMAKEEIPDVKFQALVELQQLNDCSALTGDTYRHHKVVTEMEDCIACTIREKRKEEVNNSPFVGILIDETVNITVNKKLIVFLRYVRDGSPHTVFCGNYTVPAGDAETVYKKVKEVLREEAHRVVRLGSDGASVMFGRHNGVGVRMAAESPHLVHVHCIAHHVALVASNASKDIEAISQFRRTVNGVYNLFRYSAVRYARLRELHKAMDPSDFKSLKEPCSVRWLSLTRAVDSIYSNWPSLVLCLEEERVRGNATAAGLLAQVKAFKFVAIMHMLLDVLPILGSLSRCFQEENVSIGTINPRVTGVRQRLTVLRDEFGEKEEHFMHEEFSAAEHTFRDQKLLFAMPVNVQAYKTTRTNFIEELISNLGNRFPERDLDVLSALATIFDVRNYPWPTVCSAIMATKPCSSCLSDLASQWEASLCRRRTC